MKYYRLNRLRDATGVSGIGHVADVIEGRNGAAIVLWIHASNPLGIASIVIHESLANVEALHCHGGVSVLEPCDLSETERERIMDRLFITSRKCKEMAFGMGGGAITFSQGFA